MCQRARAARRLPFLLLPLVLAGCGGNDSQTPAGKLQGREVSRSGQIAGVWMRVTSGPYLGLEFTRDNTAIVTYHVHGLQGEALTLKYSVLEGGRISLAAPTGVTELFSVVVAGDELELSKEEGSQRFRRLGSGQTLAAALRAHQAAIERERQEWIAAVTKLLASGDLVLKAADPAKSGGVISFADGQGGGRLGGTAVIDEDPSRHDPLRPIRVAPWRGELVPVDDVDPKLKLRLRFEASSPPGAGAGVITLAVDGSPNEPAIRGTGSMTSIWPAPIELVLVRDAGAHRRTAARLEEQREARRRALAAVTDPLGGRAILQGRRTGAGATQAADVRLQLERTPGATTFSGQATLGSQTHAVRTEAEVLLGAGVLFVNLANGEQWRLQRTAEGNYAGPWRPNPRSDFASHGEVSLTLGRMWTVEQVAAEREAMDRYVSQDLRQPTVLIGYVARGAKDDTEYWPARLELQVLDGENVRGQAWLLGRDVGVEVEGRRTNRSFTLQARSALPGSANDRALLAQRWQIELVSMDPDPRFEGRLSSNLGAGGPAVLVPLTDARKAAMRSGLRQAVDAPAWRVINLNISRRPEPTHFLFEKASEGKVQGTVVGADLTGRTTIGIPPGSIEGEWSEERDFPVLRLRLTGTPDPVRGREGGKWELTATAHVVGDQTLLTAWDQRAFGNQAWLKIDIEKNREAVVISPEQSFRLAAQRAGAVLTPPKQPSIGEEALIVIHVSERDVRLGHIHYANGRYSHGNSIPRAALHAGLIKPGETAVVRLRYDAPHTAPTPPVEQNGVTSTSGTFRPNNSTPTFRIERVEL